MLKSSWSSDSAEVSVEIHIVAGNWGVAKPEDVKLLLINVTQHLLGHFHGPFLARINVECHPNRTTGRVQARRFLNYKNEHTVMLATHDCCLWSFQFAHELCHIFSGYNRLRSAANFWFHEALCDAASMFVVRKMAISWHQWHLSNWAWFSIAIQDYAARLVARDDYQLPKGAIFQDWFRVNEESLRADRYQRGKNGIIALHLLPILENNPGYWDGIRFLPDCGQSFESFLHKWQKKCPVKQKPLVAKIADLFGIPLAP